MTENAEQNVTATALEEELQDVESAVGRKYLSFPRDIDSNKDRTSEAEQQGYPYVMLAISEIKRDASGLPANEQGEDSGITRDLGQGLIEGYNAITSPVGKAIIGSSVLAQLGVGTAGSALGGGAIGAADSLGLTDQFTGFINDSVQSSLGVNISGAGEALKSRLANFSLRRNTNNNVKYIILPMPDNIGVSYDHLFLETGLTQALGVPGLLAQAYGVTKGSDVSTAGASMYALELATSLARQVPGLGEGAERVLFFGTTGLALNPQLEMMFQGTGLRKFILDFKLTPKNKRDADALFATSINTGILHALKYYAAPEIPAGVSGRYFIPPAQFEITFFHGNKTNTSLIKTKKCVLNSVAVDYTPNGYVTHSDGYPAQISLQLNFTETSILSRSDFGKSSGNYR
jgi:hypothetical protein